MKIDKEALLKNQFWIGLGSAGVLLLGSLVVLFLGPAQRAANARASFTKFKETLAEQKDFKNSEFVKPWKERKDEFTGRKDRVWADAYKTQDGLMTWPPLDPVFVKLQQSGYFGDYISDYAIQQYRDIYYKTQFDNFEKFMGTSGVGAYLPVAFDPKLGNMYKWDKDKTPSVEECWLAQEEIWLRREVFRILQAALDSMATFKEVKELRLNAAVATAAGGPVDALVKNSPDLSREAYAPRPLDPNPDQSKKLAKSGIKESRLFRSHDWEVNLLLEAQPDDPSKLRISALSTIKNINPSRRLLFVGSPTGQGLRLRIRQRTGTSQGKPTYAYSDLAAIFDKQRPYGDSAPFKRASKIDSNVNPGRDFELVEAYDRATSPIKRLEKLEIGEAALADRLLAFKMDNGPLAPKVEESQGDKEQGSQGSPGSPGGAVMPGGGGGGQGAKADTSKTPNGIPRNRYILTNQVVRRIPIAFAVVLDQDYRNEVLTAVANSPLRIQTTQVYWTHRGDTAAATSGGGKSNDWGGDNSPPGGAGGGPGGGPSPMGGGAAAPGGAGGRQAGQDSGGAGAAPPASTEGNRSIVLNVHGIATLYERFPPKKKDEATPPTGQPK